MSSLEQLPFPRFVRAVLHLSLQLPSSIENTVHLGSVLVQYFVLASSAVA